MISVPEARMLITANNKTRRRELVALEESLGFVLARDIVSPIDTPPFDNSAMDGFGFSFEQWDGNSPLKVVGEIQAGDEPIEPIEKQEAVRIFTGAAVPGSIDTVVIQEKVEFKEGQLTIKDEQLTLGRNIRKKGSQTKAGALALEAGHQMTPASISLLAGLGITQVEVYAKPVIAIIVTGKELIQPGQPLKTGEIYESNGYGLSAACQQLGIEPIIVDVVGDDVNSIVASLRNASDADFIIMTGGASVGEYDLVPAALTQNGAQQIFHKVRQRPGKPFYFGMMDNSMVFGLPGNPGAVLTCFYQYIAPAIETFTQRKDGEQKKMTLINGYSKKSGLTYFLKGKANGNQVEILDHQQSYLVNSFAQADCLITLEEGRDTYEAGDEVEVFAIV